jgi:hypothetical protein
MRRSRGDGLIAPVVIVDDEPPTGYSSAGCSPAEPASASPAGNHLQAARSALSIEEQREGEAKRGG